MGIPVACLTYESTLQYILRKAEANKSCAISLCQAPDLALARSDERFRAALEHFDLLVPGSYPVVWQLNALGANLADRVYGLHFLRYALANAPAPWRHFFLGGTPADLDRLVEQIQGVQPGLSIAGRAAVPVKPWTEAAESHLAAQIQSSGADFIWVLLEDEDREQWIAANRHRYPRGVFIAVGNIGTPEGCPPVPDLTERLGLSWLWQLIHHPGGGRLLRLNARFMAYTLRDTILPAPRGLLRTRRARPHVAFLGSRGVPARYSGFEVVVEHLGTRLAERGYPVTVYNRFPRYRAPKIYNGMRVVVLPTIPTKSLDTISHTALSALHTLTRRYDVIYLCGVGNAIIGGFLRLMGYKVIINVDGADFNRAKWGSLARNWLRISESWAMKIGHRVIADNSEIVTRYQREYGATPVHLSYGAIIREKPVHCGELEHWKLTPRSYILFVSRLTPENQADLLLRAFANYRGPLKLVICGGANYEQAYYRKLESLADERVIFTGPRYGDSYLELSQNAAFYVMPADIEATRLVLLDQLGMGAAVLYHDCAATREVVADAAEPFCAIDPERSLAEKITYLSEHPERCDELRRLSLQRAKDCFHWNLVVDRYEQLFEEIGVPTGTPAA